MKTEAKNQDKCRVELVVTLDADEARKDVREVERVYVREVRLPGFRPGKVPLEIIRKEYGKDMAEEIRRATIRNHYDAAVKESGLEAVALADVKDYARSDEGATFTALVDVRPTFTLPTYKGLQVEFRDTAVPESEVTAQIDHLREQYAKYADAKDGDVVQTGDYVSIDYAGTVDGKPILEVAPDAKVVAGGTGFWTQVVEGRFLEEILDALVGMKAGETKEGVKAVFDTEAAPEPLKGKEAVYTVTVKSFRRRSLATDAEVCARMKAESIEKLAASIREQMEKRAVEDESERREQQALDLLMKKVDFDVPATQVEAAKDNYLQELQQRAQYAGIGGEYFEQHRDEILKNAEETAVGRVRLWYVFDAIAKAEKLVCQDDERGRKVIEILLANAKR